MEIPRTQVGVTRWQRFRATVDLPLVLAILAICGIGLLNLYSATHDTRHSGKFDQQLRWMAVGAVLFTVATIVDYRTWVQRAWVWLVLAIFLLLVVRLLGAGAHAKG